MRLLCGTPLGSELTTQLGPCGVPPMGHFGPKSGVKFVFLPSTSWRVWGSLKSGLLWPQPFL